MSSAPLAEWNHLVGETFESENKAPFFHALIKMQKPECLLEIGTGVGVSSFYMAQAVKENGKGHVWTVDNGSQWKEFFEPYFTDRIRRSETFGPLIDPDFFVSMRRIAERLGLAEHITFLEGEVTLADAGALDVESYPFLEPALRAPLDLVFCDIDHRPEACLGILAKFLPVVAPSASIFIDSAPTFLASHLTLEHTLRQLERSKVPAFFLVGADAKRERRLRDLISSRRFSMVPITERLDRDGNSMAWIRIEPENFLPSPLTAMRGLVPDKPKLRVSGDKVAQFFAPEPFDGSED